MPDVFISYSRKNSPFIKQLISALEAEGKGVWWDQKREAIEGIVVGSPWWEQIKYGIETANNFLFVISPDSIISPYCHAEINHARWYGKRIVTALYCHWISEEDTWKAIGAAIDAIPVANELPDVVTREPINFRSLARKNWLSLNDIQHAIFASSTSFEEPLKHLVKALDQDFAWVKMYDRVRQAALLWDENDRSDDFLWSSAQLKPVYKMIEQRKPQLDALVQSFIEPEQVRLIRELQDLKTSHQRRLKIGEQLAIIGDTRIGVSNKNENLHGQSVVIPEIDWCPVAMETENEGEILKPGSWPKIEIEGKVFEIQPFFIARYLITYDQFKAFSNDPEGFNNKRWWQGMEVGVAKTAPGFARNEYVNAPRDNVSWYQAVAFCRWLDEKYTQIGWKPDPTLQIRLPTEWEWQWVAQAGNEVREYPWGKWDDQPRANSSQAGISERSIAVGMYPTGAAACGALDMAGNLWEWCLNDYGEINQISLSNGKSKTLRGGSFYYPLKYASTSSRFIYNSDVKPNTRATDYGFRVVMGSYQSNLKAEPLVWSQQVNDEDEGA